MHFTTTSKKASTGANKQQPSNNNTATAKNANDYQSPTSSLHRQQAALNFDDALEQHQQLAPYDRTNYAQSLMHMIKGNLGTGILAMPSTFALCGLVYGVVGLPALCVVAACCVHLLVQSSQHLEKKMKIENLDYAELAKASFKTGPFWLRSKARFMSFLVDLILIVSQIGICCVYIVFVVDNLLSILKSRQIVSQPRDYVTYMYLITLLVLLPLNYIRTLRTLSFVSGIANVLQVIGITITVYLLVQPDSNNTGTLPPFTNNATNDTSTFTAPDNDSLDNEAPSSQFARLARGFAGAMFAFEGIAVVIPVYNRMKRPEQMNGLMGIINVSYGLLLVLYMIVGVTGFLKYGSKARGSISENLDGNSILADIVRSLFVVSITFSYPLQFYVAVEIIWNWIRDMLLVKTRGASSSFKLPSPIDVTKNQKGHRANNNFALTATFTNSSTKPLTQQISTDTANTEASDQTYFDTTAAANEARATIKATEAYDSSTGNAINNNDLNVAVQQPTNQDNFLMYELLCRTALVLITFVLAISIKKLRLLMEFAGAVAGTALSIILPPLIHMATFWEETSGSQRKLMIATNLSFISIGIIASVSGVFFSTKEIIHEMSVTTS